MAIVQEERLAVERSNVIKTVKYTPDPKNQPQLTAAQETKLAALSDEDIDYSEIEELDDDFWNHAQPVTSKVKASAHQKE